MREGHLARKPAQIAYKVLSTVIPRFLPELMGTTLDVERNRARPVWNLPGYKEEDWNDHYQKPKLVGRFCMPERVLVTPLESSVPDRALFLSHWDRRLVRQRALKSGGEFRAGNPRESPSL